MVAAPVAGCGGGEPSSAPSVAATASNPGGAVDDAGTGTSSATPTPTPTPTPTRPGPAFGTPLNPVRFAAAMREVDSTILDVRTPAEFAQGHLPGAINHDLSTRFRERVAPLDRADVYAVYCGASACAQQALTLMKELGFVQAYYLDGGFVAWQRAGGQVTR